MAAEPNAYVCDTCGRTFTRKTALVSHQRTHERELRAAAGELDEDALLRIIAPNGIPNNGQIVRRIGELIAEVESLRKEIASV